MVTIDQVYMNDFGDVLKGIGDVLKGTFVTNDKIFSLKARMSITITQLLLGSNQRHEINNIIRLWSNDVIMNHIHPFNILFIYYLFGKKLEIFFLQNSQKNKIKYIYIYIYYYYYYYYYVKVHVFFFFIFKSFQEVVIVFLYFKSYKKH